MAERRRIVRITGINWPGATVLVFAALAWEVTVRSGWLDYEYLPAPSAIALGWRELASEGLLAPDIAHTLISVAIGWTAATALGISLGFLLGLSATARRYSLASIEILRPMPGVAFAQPHVQVQHHLLYSPQGRGPRYRDLIENRGAEQHPVARLNVRELDAESFRSSGQFGLLKEHDGKP